MLETPTAATWNYVKFMLKVLRDCVPFHTAGGPYEMASLSNSAITNRDVMKGLVFVLYYETMFIGNLFIYT